MNNQILSSSKKKSTSNFETDNISISDFLLVISRQIKLIIIVTVFFILFSFLYIIFFTVPVYTSISKIMSSSASAGGNMNRASGIAAQFGISLPTGQSEQKWVYPEVLKSRSLAKAVLKQKFDTVEFGSEKTLLHILTSGVHQFPAKNSIESAAIDRLINMIQVSEDIKTSILTLEIHASEPGFSAKLNKNIIDALDAHQRRYNRGKTRDTKEFILERIKDTEKELFAAEEALKIFQDRNRRIENSPALQLERLRLNREVTVMTGVFTTLKQQLETSKIEEVKKSDYVIVLDAPETPLFTSKPKKKKIVILSTIAGLGFSLILAFIRDFIIHSDKKEKNKIREAKLLFRKNVYELITFK